MRVRKNVYELPAGDTTLEWYEKAVAEMKKRPTTDPTSWNYQGAIHGFKADNKYWAGAAPLPSEEDRKEFWNRCQHASWYFFSWHRMYLAYFEQIVASVIVELGGPKDWALPFWNYCDTSHPEVLNIPPAFTTPAKESNALWIEGREHNALEKSDVGLEAMNLIPFVGMYYVPQGFGGPQTAFSHSGSTFGALEQKPHNLVHLRIGGAMGDPDTAGLDPIFWLHHANIDRLWQEWINLGNERHNPVQESWLDFPFVFHNAASEPVQMTSIEVEDTTQVLDGYVYEGVPPTSGNTASFVALKAEKPEMPLEVVAANNDAKPLSGSITTIPLKLEPPKKLKANFMALPAVDAAAEVVSQSTEEQKSPTTYLLFENVTGKGVPPIYDVYLNLDTEKEAIDESHYAGSIGLFGLENASTPGTHQDGSGMNYALDVSFIVNELRSDSSWKEDALDIHIVPSTPLKDGVEVNVGRISLYSE